MSNIKYQYLSDKQFLDDLNYTKIKEVSTKIIILDREENPITEIQGAVSQGGSINVDGSSSLRRTVNLTFIPEDTEQNITNEANLISINKKIQIEVGYANTLKNKYPRYANYPIIWFPLGLFVITEASFNQDLSGKSISITGQDKMCLLNGTCGGTLPAAVSFHEVTTGVDSNGEDIVEEALVCDIIRAIVKDFGGELPHKITINDIPLTIKDTVRLSPSSEKKIYRKSVLVNGLLSHYTFSETPSSGATLINPGDMMGYKEVPFVFPTELNADAGQTVCDVLDKIKDTLLGNYEYFYDIEGNFVFQEIKNYLNTPYVEIEIDSMENHNYEQLWRPESKNTYDFKDGELIISFGSSPDYTNIYNDFVIWGENPDTSAPIRYHLAIDKKPIPLNDSDWRHALYLEGEDAEANGFKPNYYYAELKNEWEEVSDAGRWKTEYIQNPSKLQYYLDFIDTNGSLEPLSISNIGRRTKVITDSSINCIFPPKVPSIYLYAAGESVDIDIEEDAYGILSSDISSELSYSTIYKDAFSLMREIIYKYSAYMETISIQAIPIFYLEPNTRIQIYNESTNSFGEYIVNSISIPISIDETMSINGSKVLERV